MIRILSHSRLLVCFVSLLGAVFLAQSGLFRQTEVWTRDKITLSTNIFLPSNGKTKFATILFRTPYRKGQEVPNGWQPLLQAGFAIVTQDVRGKGQSTGIFGDVNQEIYDGYDTIEWISRQPWSNGCVGMLGGSYQGIVQWKAALAKPPHLCAIAPTVAGWDEYLDRYYSRGGALKLGHRMSWLASNERQSGFRSPPFEQYTKHLPINTMDQFAAGQSLSLWRTILEHPTYDAFWKRLSTKQRIAEVRVPTLITGGWYDNYAESDLEAFSTLQKQGVKTRAIMGPWSHDISYRYPGDPFGPKTMIGLRREQIAFFKQHLLQEVGADASAPLQYFLMGANEWRQSSSWPPPEAKLYFFYLTTAGALQEKTPEKGSEKDSEMGSAKFVYDPAKPVPTIGGNICCDAKIWAPGPLDQSWLRQRSDVLRFATARFSKPLTLVGPIKAELVVATSAIDTDFTVKLMDVAPDGSSRIISDGIQRLSLREGLEHKVVYKPNSKVELQISAGVTAWQFPVGHRLQLDVSSSNFPKFDRNLNSDHPTIMKIAEQTLFIGKSRLVVPLIAQ
jgi:uncharacterized protein